MKNFNSSPWGKPQSVDCLVPDNIYFVSTASHGGYWLSPKAKKYMAKKGLPAKTWYEEDCESLLVNYAFHKLTRFRLAHEQLESVKKGILFWKERIEDWKGIEL